jgi:glycosyltransferase involved in cell wall biosynthesis
VERPNLRDAACLQALTRAEVDDYRRFRLINPVAVIPNGVDVPIGVTPDVFLETWPALKGKRLIVFLSRLHPKKGLDLLCLSWSRLRRKFPEHHLVLAGPDFDRTRASIEELVNMLDMRDCVTFTGMLTAQMKWSLLAAAEVFVLPSYSEGFSVAILEAMAMALPVIITKPCNFPEVSERGSGVVVAAEPRAFETALAWMLSVSAAERREIGRKGQDLILERYTWKRVGRQLAEVYDWALGGEMPTGVPVHLTAMNSESGVAMK